MNAISPLISIIIPIYNAERFLDKCLNSIFSQTYTNFEVIAVNDGSTDNSDSICKHYESEQPNMLPTRDLSQFPLEQKVLFLVFHGFDPANGISKKIQYQAKAFTENGYPTSICYMNEDNHKLRMVDNEVIADYGTGTKSKILKRIEYDSIYQYIVKHRIGLLYMRSDHNANPLLIHTIKKIRQFGTKVIMEIPTYPYDTEYVGKAMQRRIWMDKHFRCSLAKNLDAIVTFSDNDTIFGKRTIRISNGIDFESIPLKNRVNDTSSELHLIGVAEIHTWHGFDRVINGLIEYYKINPSYKVYFHIVGYFYSSTEKAQIEHAIQVSGIEKYIILHGRKHGDELNELFEQCDMGIGSLGRHRVGITHIKTLKNREYAARGIPFVYSEIDSDFEKKDYILKVTDDESPLDINAVISFYNRIKSSPISIRNSIVDLSWRNQMGIVLNSLNMNVCDLHDKSNIINDKSINKQMPKISVVVPAYNSEKYIEKCIDSILHQEYKNIEIIIVNDGSTDNTPNICDRYAQSYSNIKVVNQENGGLSCARNTGINNSSGDYITFIDSDDYVTSSWLTDFMTGFADYPSCDMVIQGLIIDYDNHKENVLLPEKYYQKKEIIDAFFALKEKSIDGFTHNKIYKRSIIEDYQIKFEYKLKEDLLFNYNYLSHTSSLVIIPKCCYHYVQHGGDTLIHRRYPADFMIVLISAVRDAGMQLADKYNDYRFKNFLLSDFMLAYSVILFSMYQKDVGITDKRKRIDFITDYQQTRKKYKNIKINTKIKSKRLFANMMMLRPSIADAVMMMITNIRK